MTFPFPIEEIASHRCHGLMQGHFTVVDDKLHLFTNFGVLPLLPRQGKRNKAVFKAGYTQLEQDPQATINAYIYPRVNKQGKIYRAELCSFHVEGSPPPENDNGIARNFRPGEFYVCGRVRRGESGLVAVKVKTTINDEQRHWHVSGTCIGRQPTIGSKTLFLAWFTDKGDLMLQSLKEISPPGPSPSKAARSFRMTGDRTRTAPSRSTDASRPSAQIRRLNPESSRQPQSQGSPAGPSRRLSPLQRPQR